MKIRQISFRAKDFHSNWVHGDLNMLSNIPYIRTDIRHEYAINTNTIGQFTGLKDKNDKNIYEGDIVTKCGTKYICIWKDKYACFVFAEKDENGEYNYFQECDKEELEVIGNIYDNPELLKY